MVKDRNHQKVDIPRLVIGAPASGSGKTTFSMGLMAAFCRQGFKVQPFKVGPDYIDPAFHTAITGRNSINLDSWMLSDTYIKEMFERYAQEADLSIVEGVMGLYDGYGDDPLKGSTAGIAGLLQAPVILVMTVDAMAASAAAVVYGLKEFGRVNVAGVVINKASSYNHYLMVKRGIEKYTGVKVVGYLPKTGNIQLKSRHLGLVQSSETENLSGIIDSLADLIKENVNLEMILAMAREAPQWEASSKGDMSNHYGSCNFLREKYPSRGPKIAVAWDHAFSFYYYENLEILKGLGADLAFFSPMRDEVLPEDINGLYIGGGYPEVFAKELSANISLMQDIREKADKGLPIYAECGGYMYLNKCFKNEEGEVYPFVGIFDGEAVMTKRLQNFGYLELEGLKNTLLFKKGERIRAHEFHKSLVLRNDDDYCIMGEKKVNEETVRWQCGRKYKNVFGMYPHIYFPANLNFALNFVKTCQGTVL
ncbi:MAG: cobyrinate a,c-diamide synthase [Bacillota bacterium]|jgi:cobyrinic acid a,c-diamide synthase|nr:cobyrinate a,c-diamide synthase [Clostridia bacterium]